MFWDMSCRVLRRASSWLRDHDAELLINEDNLSESAMAGGQCEVSVVSLWSLLGMSLAVLVTRGRILSQLKFSLLTSRHFICFLHVAETPTVVQLSSAMLARRDCPPQYDVSHTPVTMRCYTPALCSQEAATTFLDHSVA